MSIGGLREFIHRPHAWLWDALVETPVMKLNSAVSTCKSKFAQMNPTCPLKRGRIQYTCFKTLRNDEVGFLPSMLDGIKSVEGNVATLRQAEIIIIFDTSHGDTFLQANISKFIRTFAKDGDVVLREGYEAMLPVEPEEQLYASQTVKEYGWDDESLCKIIQDFETKEHTFEIYYRRILDRIRAENPRLGMVDCWKLTSLEIDKDPELSKKRKQLHKERPAYKHALIDGRNDKLIETLIKSRSLAKKRFLIVGEGHKTPKLLRDLPKEPTIFITFKAIDPHPKSVRWWIQDVEKQLNDSTENKKSNAQKQPKRLYA